MERRPPVSPVSDAAATVMTVAARLDTRPPANLDVAIVFAGGGDAHAAGLRRWLSDRRRRGLDPSSVAIVQIEPRQDDAQTWWEHDGLLFGAATHQQLTDAARSAATSTSGRAGEHRAVTTPAGIVRADGWPAIAISAS